MHLRLADEEQPVLELFGQLMAEYRSADAAVASHFLGNHDLTAEELEQRVNRMLALGDQIADAARQRLKELEQLV